MPMDSPTPPVSFAVPAKPAAESGSSGSAARTAPPASESSGTPVQQPASEHPSAAAMSNATAREALARVESAVPSPRTHLTVEHIRELQALVSRALQSAHTGADGSAQANFNWTPEGFGSLRFTIVSRRDGVQIEISAGRRDVVEALEEGRASVERMIADAGLRVERFEVRLRAPEFSDSLLQPREDGQHPERNSSAQWESDDATFVEQDSDDSVDETVPQRRLSLAEHEWVA
jgi:hypothetical protein